MHYDHSNSEFENSDSTSMPAPNSGGSNPHKPNPARPAETTSETKLHHCSYCGEAFQRSQTKHMPFCSKRCQQIDLGMWLNESYGFPYEGSSKPEGFGSDDELE